jgi:GntR family transcriptional regulator
VAKAYRELEHEGVIELRQGAGAFVTAAARQARPEAMRAAQSIIGTAIEKLRHRGVADGEIRRMFEAELAGRSGTGAHRG